jgi:class 3 adenylate cyclase/sugar lactone lactonase YvrE
MAATERRKPGRRVLLAVLFTDIAGSTDLASELGDDRWRRLLSEHNSLVRLHLRRFGGQEVDTAGDGFFAVFKEPGDALRCVIAARDAARDRLGLVLRGGLHFGECEMIGRKAGGITVHIGARLLSQAAPGEIVMSRTFHDLVAGLSMPVRDLGTHRLKGVPDEWHLFSLPASEPGPSPAGSTLLERLRASDSAPPAGARTRRRPRAPVVAGLAVALLVVAAMVFVLATRGKSPQAEPTGHGGSPSPPTTGPSAPTTGPSGTATPGSEAPPLNSVVVVDPATGKISTTIPDIPTPCSVTPKAAAGEGGIWIRSCAAVVRVDVARREVDRTKVVQFQMGASSDLAIAGRTVWITSASSPGKARLTRLDPATGATFGVTTFRTDASIQSIAGGGSVLWLGFSDGKLVRLDAASGREVGHIVAPGFADALAIDGSTLWTVDRLAGTATQLEADTGRVLRTVGDLGSPSEDLVVAFGTLWIVDESAGTVLPVDTATGTRSQAIRVGDSPTDIVAGPDAVWVTDATGSVWRIDPSTRDATSIDIGTPAATLAVVRGKLWVELAKA